jgi:hypothetical protein
MMHLHHASDDTPDLYLGSGNIMTLSSRNVLTPIFERKKYKEKEDHQVASPPNRILPSKIPFLITSRSIPDAEVSCYPKALHPEVH